MSTHDRETRPQHDTAEPRSNEPRQMLTEAELLDLLPFGRTTLHNMIKQGFFPRGVNVSPNRKAWFSTQIVDWQNAIEASDPHHNPARGRGKGRRPRMSLVKGG
jgi:predicted DNA-binding transcriptional regulator AlpA